MTFRIISYSQNKRHKKYCNNNLIFDYIFYNMYNNNVYNDNNMITCKYKHYDIHFCFIIVLIDLLKLIIMQIKLAQGQLVLKFYSVRERDSAIC